VHTKTHKMLMRRSLIFNRLLEVAKVHVRAKFHQAMRFMSYRVNREKNLATMVKTILPSLPRAVNIKPCVDRVSVKASVNTHF